MIHFKNDGFSLIEVMLAITIMGLMLVPLFLLENTVVDNVSTMALRFRQALSAQNFLYEARRSQLATTTKFNLEKKDEALPFIFQYTLAPLPTHSAFKKNRNLYSETVTVSEHRKKGEKQKLVTIQFKPPKEAS